MIMVPDTTIWSRVTGLTDAPPSVQLMPLQKKAQRLALDTLSWWPIYMGYPNHLKLAGVARSHTHTQERLQAIQELSDQIFSP